MGHSLGSPGRWPGKQCDSRKMELQRNNSVVELGTSGRQHGSPLRAQRSLISIPRVARTTDWAPLPPSLSSNASKSRDVLPEALSNGLTRRLARIHDRVVAQPPVVRFCALAGADHMRVRAHRGRTRSRETLLPPPFECWTVISTCVTLRVLPACPLAQLPPPLPLVCAGCHHLRGLGVACAPCGARTVTGDAIGSVLAGLLCSAAGPHGARC